MEPYSPSEPVSTLRLTEIDTDLIMALARHWLVTVEQQEDVVLIELYERR